MGYVEEHNLIYTTTNDLHKKVVRAIDKAARDVISELPSVEHHDQRLQWAVGVREHPAAIAAQAHKLMPYVLDNATVAAGGNASADNDVQFVVNGLVDTMAGV